MCFCTCNYVNPAPRVTHLIAARCTGNKRAREPNHGEALCDCEYCENQSGASLATVTANHSALELLRLPSPWSFSRLRVEGERTTPC